MSNLAIYCTALRICLEWALSFYNIIPERVAVVTSVTTGANKQYETPIGTFLYRHLHMNIIL